MNENLLKDDISVLKVSKEHLKWEKTKMDTKLFQSLCATNRMDTVKSAQAELYNYQTEPAKEFHWKQASSWLKMRIIYTVGKLPTL